MDFEKELALALDFKSAPKELQDLATQHYDNIKALAKAKAHESKATIAVFESERAYQESAKALRVALKNWNPTIESTIKESR